MQRNAASLIPAATVAVLTPSQTDTTNPKIAAIEDFKKKIAPLENFQNKKNVNDLLQDITAKVQSNQSVWNYQTEALKGFLADQPSLKEDLDKLIVLLSQPN